MFARTVPYTDGQTAERTAPQTNPNSAAPEKLKKSPPLNCETLEDAHLAHPIVGGTLEDDHHQLERS